MSTPKIVYLAAWRLRWAKRLLGIGGDLRNYRAEIHGAEVTVWGHATNPHNVSHIITYTKDRP